MPGSCEILCKGRCLQWMGSKSDSFRKSYTHPAEPAAASSKDSSRHTRLCHKLLLVVFPSLIVHIFVFCHVVRRTGQTTDKALRAHARSLRTASQECATGTTCPMYAKCRRPLGGLSLDSTFTQLLPCLPALGKGSRIADCFHIGEFWTRSRLASEDVQA